MLCQSTLLVCGSYLSCFSPTISMYMLPFKFWRVEFELDCFQNLAQPVDLEMVSWWPIYSDVLIFVVSMMPTIVIEIFLA